MATTKLEDLPEVRGKYRPNAMLGTMTWFGVGGPADILFKPEDTDDLIHFLKSCSKSLKVSIFGVASNLLIRDGGIEGVVIRLGRSFTEISYDDRSETLIAGAGALDLNVAKFAANHHLAGLEFLAGIPGTIGGAVFMNAGAYGDEIKDHLLWAEAVTRGGELLRLSNEELQFSYRHSIAHKRSLFFTKACFKVTKQKDNSGILKKIEDITTARETTQPVRTKTGGSTFRNPEGHKAWELIDQVGGRGHRVGGAHFSELHCNFMVNDQNASAEDIETLGDEIKQKVYEKTGISLKWEIQRIGRKKDESNE